MPRRSIAQQRVRPRFSGTSSSFREPRTTVSSAFGRGRFDAHDAPVVRYRTVCPGCAGTSRAAHP